MLPTTFAQKSCYPRYTPAAIRLDSYLLVLRNMILFPMPLTDEDQGYCLRNMILFLMSLRLLNLPTLLQ